jgi:nitronate monooxygenase
VIRPRPSSDRRQLRRPNPPSGGQTGWLNPFAFVRAVRAFFAGPLVLAGGISDGYALRAAQALGCDLAHMGTRFIATEESMADIRYKHMLVHSNADDILLTRAFTGLQTNMLRPSIVAAGLDPDALPERSAIDIAEDIDVGAREQRSERWRDIWSALGFSCVESPSSRRADRANAFGVSRRPGLASGLR